MTDQIQVMSLGDRERAENIAANVMARIPGSDAVAQSQAIYTVSNKIRATALPPWLIDLMIAFAIELIKKWMDERNKPAPPAPELPVIAT